MLFMTERDNDFAYVPRKDAKFARSYTVNGVFCRQTVADFYIQMLYFFKQDFSALSIE